MARIIKYMAEFNKRMQAIKHYSPNIERNKGMKNGN